MGDLLLGAAACSAFSQRRLAVYFRARSSPKWMVERMDDAHAIPLKADDFRADLCDLHEEGELQTSGAGMAAALRQSRPARSYPPHDVKATSVPVGMLWRR